MSTTEGLTTASIGSIDHDLRVRKGSIRSITSDESCPLMEEAVRARDAACRPQTNPRGRLLQTS